MITRWIAILLITSAGGLHAEPRPWKDADGKRSVMGDFIRRDATSVTIRRADAKEVSIPLEKLHPEDRTWLNATHPLPSPAAPPPAANAVFDQLTFGDSREEVTKKLKASKFVEMTTDETFIGRSGLNGVFRTRKKIGGLDAMLYFDWTGDNRLKEITLQTDPLPADDAAPRLKPCWKSFVELLTTLQGPPVHAEKDIHFSSIPDGTMAATHLWKLEKSGSAKLGAAREGDRFQIVVRFSKEAPKVVELP